MWDMCQMLNIWHISHTKHKNQLPSGVAYVPKLYHICPYCCKFATVWTDVVKPNNVLYLLLSLPSHFRSWLLISSLSLFTSDQSFPQQLNKHYLLLSLLSLPVLTLDFFSLSSHIRPKLPSTAQQRKNKMTLQLDLRRSKSSSWERPFDRINATPIGSSPLSSPSEVQAAWARPLRSSPLRSDHRHSNQIIAIVIVVGGASGMGEATPIIHIVIAVVIAAPISLISLSFLVVVVLIVGGWVDGGRLIRLWVWDLGWYWYLSLGWLGWLILVDRVLIVVFVWVFFFFGSSGWYWWSVVDLWGGRWLWAVPVDLWCGLLLLLLFFFLGSE